MKKAVEIAVYGVIAVLMLLLISNVFIQFENPYFVPLMLLPIVLLIILAFYINRRKPG